MPELPLNRIVRPELNELKAYLPVQGAFKVRLDANEAPPLLSDHARQCLAETAAATSWERYPDASVGDLTEALARHCAVRPEEVLVGVGSDEIIGLLLTVLSNPPKDLPAATLLTTTPTFVMYRMSARVRGMRVVEVPLDRNWDLDANGLLRALDMAQPNLVFLASPNNPTGTKASRDRLETIIEAAGDALVVLDEAYIDYAPEDQLDLYRKHPNVAILRTLSKVGFAALRIGWLIARPELVQELNKARLPYNLSTLAQNLARVVLTELWPEVDAICKHVKAERDVLASALSAIDGVEVTPSAANFLWLKLERPAEEVFSGLAERGVLIRSFHQRGGRLAKHIRVTVGTCEENQAFLAALSEVM